jgi:lysophospholipase L1-like esterase
MRYRLLALLTAATLSVMAVSPALAHEDSAGYLAVGDSVAFGTNPLRDPSDADNFVGYPEVFARFAELNLTNASCPGEASGGFISLTGEDNVCRPYRAAYPLHADYDTSQLDFAVGFLTANPNTALITINIGANDLFVLQRRCSDDPDCIVAGLPALLNALGSNLKTIYAAILKTGFRGILVAVTYYLTDYQDATAVELLSAINGVVADITTGAGGRVADGFGAFEGVAADFGGNSCEAGLLIRIGPGPMDCDIHPSAGGQAVLALAIAAALRGH